MLKCACGSACNRVAASRNICRCWSLGRALKLGSSHWVSDLSSTLALGMTLASNAFNAACGASCNRFVRNVAVDRDSCFHA